MSGNPHHALSYICVHLEEMDSNKTSYPLNPTDVGCWRAS